MLSVVYEFFGIVGLDIAPPATMSELIPWLVCVFVALVLVIAVFRVILGMARVFLDYRRVR